MFFYISGRGIRNLWLCDDRVVETAYNVSIGTLRGKVSLKKTCSFFIICGPRLKVSRFSVGFFWSGFAKTCILRVHRDPVRKIADWKTFVTIFGQRSENFWRFFRKYLAVLSKMRSTSSKKQLETENWFEKRFVIRCGKVLKIFWQNVQFFFQRVVKIAFYVSMEKIEGKYFFWNFHNSSKILQRGVEISCPSVEKTMMGCRNFI